MDRPAPTAAGRHRPAGRLSWWSTRWTASLARLADFARMMELFDRHEVSFVSVTQPFNTTAVDGPVDPQRAAVVRPVRAGNHQRADPGQDRGVQSRGMWMGGALPIGFDLPVRGQPGTPGEREVEAETVRTIFRTLSRTRSRSTRWEHWLVACRHLLEAARDAEEQDHRGDCRFHSGGALFHLLRNPIYLGHDRTTQPPGLSPGMHPAIVDADLFEAVRTKLDVNARHRAASRDQVARAPLLGRYSTRTADDPDILLWQGAAALSLLCLRAASTRPAAPRRRRGDPQDPPLLLRRSWRRSSAASPRRARPIRWIS